MRMHFPYPEPTIAKTIVEPVFIPFAGCKIRCVFCAQTQQTGMTQRPVTQVLQDLDIRLGALHANDSTPRELAFYGGTFTSLPQDQQLSLLAVGTRYRDLGLITKIRCSTRPDAVTHSQLTQLKKAGLDMVELGVQSFSNAALAQSKRGYTSECARNACHMVHEANLTLGIQLMPGMPGVGTTEFAADSIEAGRLKPEIVRLYPCLVIAGTELAATWSAGLYRPWTLDEVLEHLPPAVLSIWHQGITVSRIGLALDDGLTPSILAGPVHPALGGRIKARALAAYIEGKIRELPEKAQALLLPQRAQGVFWGHQGELTPRYADMGIAPNMVHWWDKEYCELS